jgi:hypothetical protein
MFLGVKVLFQKENVKNLNKIIFYDKIIIIKI